jgi:hypothetical protein
VAISTYQEAVKSRISDRAIALLRRDYRDSAAQMRAVRWAEDEFNRLGLWPVGNLPREKDPANIVFNLIEGNALLRDWMRARLITEGYVLAAEDFRDLVDRLTPAYAHD